MSQSIEAILLDTGNTMRVVEKDPVFQGEARKKLTQLVGTKELPDAFCERLAKRYQDYKKWTKEKVVEVSEVEMWTRWMLPDFPAEAISKQAGKLTRLWMDQLGRRVMRPDVRPTIIELNKRGYVLGIIANSISQTEIPEWLKNEDLEKYFKAVVLSAVFMRRKPDPYIFLEAAKQAGVNPGSCAYVGDNPSRDIEGAKLAGYGKVIILLEQATLKKEPPRGKNHPDGIIGEFKGVLDFFPPLV